MWMTVGYVVDMDCCNICIKTGIVVALHVSLRIVDYQYYYHYCILKKILSNALDVIRMSGVFYTCTNCWPFLTWFGCLECLIHVPIVDAVDVIRMSGVSYTCNNCWPFLMWFGYLECFIHVPIVDRSWHTDLDCGLLCLPHLGNKWSQRVWPVHKRCLLLHRTWLHLWYIEGSVQALFFYFVIPAGFKMIMILPYLTSHSSCLKQRQVIAWCCKQRPKKYLLELKI
jgi:hypothetical protein